MTTAGRGALELHHRVHRPGADTGAATVLVHGMGGSHATWRRQVRALTGSGRTVITLDLRGHGRSPAGPTYLFDDYAADVIGLCDRLGLDRVDLVGHSLGAMVCATVSAHLGERVGAAVLEEMPLPLRPGDPVPEIPQVRPSAAEIARAAAALLRDPAALRGFDRAGVEPAARDQFLSPRPEFWDRLAATTSPLLLVRGTRPGSMVDPALAAAAAATAPDLTVAEIDSGHSVHRDRGPEFTALMTGFLGQRSAHRR